ncbi:MAG: M48 family metallopeptidase [Acidobacteriota bacterium]|nr:M48 family metallopeptidase [Acidobacteriota bacterium]
MKGCYLPVAGLLCAALATAPAAAQNITNPELFAKSAEAAIEALRVYGPYDDAAQRERVNRIGYSIARHSNFDKYPFSFFVIDMAVPNAFALPAGHIFITRGMLDLGLDDDMLAAILGHEVAHVTEEHFLKMRKRATMLNVLSQALTVGAMVGAAQVESEPYVDGWGMVRSDSQTADLVQGAAMTGMLLTELLLRSYSRGNEDESDEQGQRFAAAAGFDPAGGQRLMARMEERMPQDQSFGYLQTHPFFEERVRAARARKSTFKVQEPRPVEPYRKSTQAALLTFVSHPRSRPETDGIAKTAALAAWPRGPVAEGLRGETLHTERAEVEAARPLGRDYGKLMTSYQKQIEEVFSLTPDSTFLADLDTEMSQLRTQRDRLYPDSVSVLEGGIYETPFLETFVSNFRDSDRGTEAALALGEAYARLLKEAEAVEHLLRVWTESGDGELSGRAERALSILTPRIDRLAALQSIADEAPDDALSNLASGRLAQRAERFEELDNGAEFLDRHPTSPLATRVSARQDALADEMYKEAIVYQRVGDHTKAVDRIHRILTYAPLSPAAKTLSETVMQ